LGKTLGFSRFRAIVSALFLLVRFASVPISALEYSVRPPSWPGEAAIQASQRGLDEIEAIPTRLAACPVCAFRLQIPEPDRLMRRPTGDGAAAGSIPWRMDAAERDADGCPYPGPGRLAFQADVVLCPSCGYARAADRFEERTPPELSVWTLETLRPALRVFQREFLGARGAEISETELMAFFGRQEYLPDALRLEHARATSEAFSEPYLVRARIAWLAAWAIRRELAGPPRGESLRRLTEKVRETVRRAIGKTGKTGKLAALDFPLPGADVAVRRVSLPFPERLAAPVVLAGLLNRLGLRAEAVAELASAAGVFAERFVRPEQDPLWTATAVTNRNTRRREELEAIRREAEKEILTRIDMARREGEYLEQAIELIRQGFLVGECDGDWETADFLAYLAGEFLRRIGNLPLAAEWLKNLAVLVSHDSVLGQAVENRLEIIREQAGERINLLAALGQDGDVFMKLREIHSSDVEATGK
jgi:hypothetical protein